MNKLSDFRLYSAWDGVERARWVKAFETMHRDAPNPIALPAALAATTLTRTAALTGSTYVPANGAKYPTGHLGDALRDVSQLIKAGVGLRVAAVDFGEWDYHDNMGKVGSGAYRDHLSELVKALAAFATDLGPALKDVTLITVSEFGRRVAENGSGGTDHGLGNAMLMLGGGIVGGKVHGSWPGLAPAALKDGDLAATTDYRQVLAEIVAKRFGATPGTIFPGLSAVPIVIARAA